MMDIPFNVEHIVLMALSHYFTNQEGRPVKIEMWRDNFPEGDMICWEGNNSYHYNGDLGDFIRNECS